MAEDREEMLEWLREHCKTPHEYQFWFEFYDDLDDCFDDLEPWRLFGEGWIENERRAMRGEPKLEIAVVGNRYFYTDPVTGRDYPELGGVAGMSTL